MAVILAPDVVRFTVNGDLLGAPTATILDMVVQADDSGEGRPAAMEETAAVILDAWVDELLPLQVPNFSLTSISWVDLTSLDGTVGEIVSTDDNTLPLTGTRTGEATPSQIAALVTKVCSSNRGTRNGRLFFPGLSEEDVSGNYMTVAYTALLVDAWSNMTEILTETGVALGANYFPTVVHTRNNGTPQNPNIVYVGNTQVTNFLPQRQVATQRRRNRRV